MAPTVRATGGLLVAATGLALASRVPYLPLDCASQLAAYVACTLNIVFGLGTLGVALQDEA